MSIRCYMVEEHLAPNPDNGANYHDGPYSNISFLLMSSLLSDHSEPGLSIIFLRSAFSNLEGGLWQLG